MKTFLSLTFLVLTTFLVRAHDYHFAFAEVAYNTSTQTVQTTIIVSTHDFEHSMYEEGVDIGHLENCQGNKLLEISISDELLAHFTIQMGEQNCVFRLMGFEVLNSGMTHFYFESERIDWADNATVTFDLMMDHNPEQQNKLTWIVESKKISIPFLYNERKQHVILKQ